MFQTVVVSIAELDHLRELVAAGGVGELLEDPDFAVVLATLLRERLIRVVGGREVVTSAGHEFVRCAVVTGLTASGDLDRR